MRDYVCTINAELVIKGYKAAGASPRPTMRKPTGENLSAFPRIHESPGNALIRPGVRPGAPSPGGRHEKRLPSGSLFVIG